MSELEIFDFDRNLYDTDGFTDALLANLEFTRQISQVQHNELLDAFEAPDSVDIVDLITQRGITMDELNELVLGLSEDFVYGDARVYLADCENPFILTTAVSVMLQKHKIEQAGFNRIPRKILQSNKGLFLRDTIHSDKDGLSIEGAYGGKSFDRVIFYEDRFSAVEPLLEGDIEVRLMQRTDAKYVASEDEMAKLHTSGGEVIHSFEEVRQKAA